MSARRRIAEHISNPFRDDITDYSFKMFHARLRNECMAFFKCASDPPYTTEEDPEPAVLPPQFIERQVNTAMYVWALSPLLSSRPRPTDAAERIHEKREMTSRIESTRPDL